MKTAVKKSPIKINVTIFFLCWIFIACILTNNAIGQIDELTAKKEQEIMQV